MTKVFKLLIYNDYKLRFFANKFYHVNFLLYICIMKNQKLESATVIANQICQKAQDLREFLENSQASDVVSNANYSIHNNDAAKILLEATEYMVSEINQIPMTDKLLIKADKIKNEVRFLERQDPNVLISSKMFLANLKRFQYILTSYL